MCARKREETLLMHEREGEERPTTCKRERGEKRKRDREERLSTHGRDREARPTTWERER